MKRDSQRTLKDLLSEHQMPPTKALHLELYTLLNTFIDGIPDTSCGSKMQLFTTFLQGKLQNMKAQTHKSVLVISHIKIITSRWSENEQAFLYYLIRHISNHSLVFITLFHTSWVQTESYMLTWILSIPVYNQVLMTRQTFPI